MIVPQTFGTALLVLILGLLCLGSWASMFKLAGKFRYELFYVDFALGAVLVALLWAYTFGNLGFSGLAFTDDLNNSGKREWFLAFVAGVVFNLGNMFLLSSVSVSGMTVAFPTAFAVALTVSAAVGAFVGPAGNTTLLLCGCLLLILAIIANAIGYNMLTVLRHEILARAGKTKSTRRPSSAKGMVLALVAGLLLGSYLPLVDKARETEIGLGPFSLAVLFTVGLFVSTFVFSIFFINLPAQGEPANVGDYLKAGVKGHAKGLAAGAIWCTGMLAVLVTAHAADLFRDAQWVQFFLSQAAPLVAALWGLLAWKEFRDGDMRVRSMSILMLVLFAAGLVLVALAQGHVPIPT